MTVGSDIFQATAIRDFVVRRRAAAGRKFETCERMRPAFEGLDAAGWNDWTVPAPETFVSRELVGTEPVHETKVSPSAFETKVSPSAFETKVSPSAFETKVSPWITAGVSRATWFRRRKRETAVSDTSAARPWIAAGISRATWYRRHREATQ
jgi:hypothetical protein